MKNSNRPSPGPISRPWPAHVVAAAALLVFALGLGGFVSNLRHDGPAAGKPLSPPPYAIPTGSVAFSNLTISGALTAKSMPSRGSTCGYRSANLRLIFVSDPMRAGSEVVQVSFDVSLSNSRVGAYSAVSPLGEYGRTPVVLSKAQSEATGIGTFWDAISGQVTVRQTAHVGEAGVSGLVSGRLDVNLVHERDGGSPIHLLGTFSCVIDGLSNGPS